ncbi:tRNA 4-thiouridine(8) synthase ThiI [Halobellus sp. MBLA0160]|uniref:Probable tRNA sulfurtransferase n=2 Tax=Halobellus ruber TaxID=2761102 RepID=A0A7J9SI97_9EURY|nr:tRNA 4-thiouridine(8) synthase ThiI [Halobellus ruber]
MADRVAADVAAALREADVDAEVEQLWSRTVVRTGRPTAAAQAAATLPGVGFARPAVATEARLDAIGDAARSLAAAASHGSDETYAVDSDRVGADGDHPFSNRDLQREAGRVVGETTGAAVDLDDPDRTYRIEVREAEAFVSVRRFRGPGGLPVGSQGRVAVLVSGGIDSPVAMWRLLRRGCATVPVYVDLGDYGGADHRARALAAVATLASRAPRADLRPRVVDGGPLVERVVDATRDTRMLSLRRAMLAAADGAADRADAHSLATGEAIGQKSSQTGANLAATDAAASRPVHRPLLASDKADIVAEARRLGTYDGSTVPVGCERIAPSHPETNATPAAVVDAEPESLLEAAREAGRDAEIVPL